MPTEDSTSLWTTLFDELSRLWAGKTGAIRFYTAWTLVLFASTCVSAFHIQGTIRMSTAQGSNAKAVMPEDEKTGDGAYWEDMWNPVPGEKRLAPGEAFDKYFSSPLLVKYIQEGLIPKGRALVPGCGRGYDVAALAAPDREAMGLDIAPTGVAEATAYLSSLDPQPAGKWSVVQGDFFELQDTFDFVFDYTFLCALPPSFRERWALKMRQLVKPNGGLLLTLIFPICSDEKVGGPPFQVSLEELRALLEPVGFVCEELRMLPSELCHPGRDGTGSWGAKTGVGRWVIHEPAKDA